MAPFERLMSMLDYPMFIVTVRDGDERSGCLIGFATQSSIHPPRFLAGLSKKNHTYRVARRSAHLAVHFVPADATALAELFGGQTGDRVDKFAQVPWHEGPLGLPILDECENWFVGGVMERIDFGDHVGFVLDPLAVGEGPEDQQFTFHRARRIEPGHEP
jgi:flavin reductase (DIM6/NTAB) family NADH-FMN oxidoreductase RutF